MTDENIIQQRKDSPFYCPACGRGYPYAAECRGATLETPHPPVQTVSTDELQASEDHPHGNPEDHTPAPTSE